LIVFRHGGLVLKQSNDDGAKLFTCPALTQKCRLVHYLWLTAARHTGQGNRIELEGDAATNRLTTAFLTLGVSRGPPSQTWLTFPRNHADAIAAIDLCVVPTLTFECLFAFFVVGHGRRQLMWFAVTRHPTQAALCAGILSEAPTVPWSASKVVASSHH